ncbi:MAG: hypothetical protein ACJ71W_00720 [Terriglobales bacterium]
MVSIILFTTRRSHPLTEELTRHGMAVHEALEVSEVFALARQHREAYIVITHEVDGERARAIQRSYPTITLKPDATAQDVISGGNGKIPIQ